MEGAKKSKGNGKALFRVGEQVIYHSLVFSPILSIQSRVEGHGCGDEVDHRTPSDA